MNNKTGEIAYSSYLYNWKNTTGENT